MAETPKVYVICDQNCKFEGMTKEQILTAIMQAVETGTISDVDTGFITTIKTINGTALKFFVGEQHEYEALTEEEKKGLFAIITNDETNANLNRILEELKTIANEHENKINEVATNAAKSFSGSYVGTGYYGEDYKNRITLDFVPQVLMIGNPKIAGNKYSDGIIFGIHGQEKEINTETMHDNHSCKLKGKLTGKTFEWWLETDSSNSVTALAKDQFNQYGVTYDYTVIGYMEA